MRPRERLEKDKAQYTRLKTLTQQTGWTDFMKMVEDEYFDALNSLKNPKYAKQEQEARGVIKFIDRLMARMSTELRFGKVAQERYIAQYINPQEE